MSLMFFAAAMAALLGVVTLARGLGTGTSGCLNRSHDSFDTDTVLCKAHNPCCHLHCLPEAVFIQDLV